MHIFEWDILLFYEGNIKGCDMIGNKTFIHQNSKYEEVWKLSIKCSDFWIESIFQIICNITEGCLIFKPKLKENKLKALFFVNKMCV